MKVLEIIPFAKGVPFTTLTYFTKEEAGPGTMVSVPLRGKTVRGLAVSVREAAESKSSLKTSRYMLRKVAKVLGKSALSESFLRSAARTAEFYAAGTGEILAQVAPESLLSRLSPADDKKTQLKKERTFKSEKFVLQRELPERLDYWKTYIRTEFAKKASVALIVPTNAEAEAYALEISRGIEPHTHTFHGGLPRKEFEKRLSKLREETHPVLIVATPYYLALLSDDVETIIVEHESSNAYRTIQRPYIDFRVFAEVLAYVSGRKLVFADAFLQVETLFREESHELVELLPIKWRFRVRGECVILDTRKKDEREKFALIHELALGSIRDALERKGNVFVYVARRGLHPLTSCNDCGTTLVCPRCSAPLVLHGRQGGERVFVCHTCKATRGAEEPCPVCESWRLTPLGYGTESVAAALKEILPDVRIERLDRDSAKTPAQAKKIARDFEKKKGALLVGTEMALYYLERPQDTVLVASIDSLFTLPSFRIREKIFQTLLSLRSRSERSFIMQTRLPDRKLLEQVAEGDLVNFYRDEVRERKTFGFPPAVRLIKLTLEGKKPHIDAEAAAVKKLLAEYSPEAYSAFISKVKNLYRMHVVLKLPPARWNIPELGGGRVEEKLASLLRILPPSVSIRVAPEDLL